MDTSILTKELHRFNLQKQRFHYRLNFFARCIKDIESDFHKQYGSFYQDWDVTLEACTQYQQATEDYLRSRDVIAIEFELLLGALEVAETTYARKKAVKKFTELMEICQSNDELTLSEIDEDIQNVRAVYRMIHVAEHQREE